MKCAECGRSDKPVFRSNPKGEAAIWKCEEHLAKPVPQDLKNIVYTIHNRE